ncbi:hypothetical protein ACOSQ3_019790 [Xanthoceras sorbifolium]
MTHAPSRDSIISTASTLDHQHEVDVSSSSSAQQVISSPPRLNVHPMVTQSKNGIFKPNAYTSTWHLPAVFLAETAPRTVKEALSSPYWKLAMQDEYSALIRNKTWSLVPGTSSMNIVRCKWVFRTKFNPDGTILKHKAQLVAKGFH